MLEVCHNYKSKNFTDKIIKPEYIVIHCICWDDEKSLNFLANNELDVSAHYFIGQTGKVFNLVDDNKRAWHAGRSKWKNSDALNDNSIGIELGNNGQEFNENEFAEKQYASLILLLQDLFKRYNLGPDSVVAHFDISSNRKTDPGAKFNWQKLIDANLALDFSTTTLDPKQALSNFGYSFQYDEEVVIKAFQRRFIPNNITGEFDKITKDFINSKYRG